MSFNQTIDQSVWDSLMSQTSSPKSVSAPQKVKQFTGGDAYKNADGNWVRAKFKAPIRDAVKDMIDFWQHKQGTTNCSALDASISKGNSLLSLHGSDKKAFNQAVEDAWTSPVKRDAKITNQRGKYAAQMLEQYTNELQSKRDRDCRVSGDKALDYAQRDLDASYGDLGYTPPSMGYQPQQAGFGGSGNMMIYLTLGAIALAGVLFIKARSPQPTTYVNG